jgi:predicted transcriptional regulator
MSEQINYEEIIKSWKWRIVKAGHKQSSFARLVGASEAVMSTYILRKVTPMADTFCKIENKLRELGV